MTEDASSYPEQGLTAICEEKKRRSQDSENSNNSPWRLPTSPQIILYTGQRLCHSAPLTARSKEEEKNEGERETGG